MRQPTPRRAVGPRRAIRQRNPLRGIAAGTAAALVAGLGVYGVTQSTSASASAQPSDTLTPMSATSMAAVVAKVSTADAEQQAISADLEARQTVLTQQQKDISKEAARLASLGKFYYPTIGEIGSPWGMRLHPILHYYRMHDGVDIGADCNAPIWAVLPGKVTVVASGGQSGNHVEIDHGMIGGKHFVTQYLHMNKFMVKEGATVTRGQQIGLVGSTGLSTSCHLHLALDVNEVNVDPAPFLKR